MIIAAYYGATYQTDAYNTAINIMGLSTVIISAGIATVIIPMYNQKLIQKNKEEADIFANNILWITSLFYIALSITGIISAPILVKVFAPEFDIETVGLTINIIRITFIFSAAANMSNYLTSMAKIHNKFSVTIIAGYPFTALTVIFTIFLAKHIGVYALVMSYILFFFVHSAILIFSLRIVFKLKAVLNFTNGDLKELIKLSSPVYINAAIWEINAIIDKILASGLSAGNISAMSYAEILRNLPDGIITTAVMTVIFPLLSQYAAKKDYDNLKAAA
jgi:putative peptidoglycan lipid II flippase